MVYFKAKMISCKYFWKFQKIFAFWKNLCYNIEVLKERNRWEEYKWK